MASIQTEKLSPDVREPQRLRSCPSVAVATACAAVALVACVSLAAAVQGPAGPASDWWAAGRRLGTSVGNPVLNVVPREDVLDAMTSIVEGNSTLEVQEMRDEDLDELTSDLPFVGGLRAQLAVAGWQCSNKCYRGLGFWDSDCSCDRHRKWYMWVCSSYQGKPIKTQFCGSGHCNGCKAPSSPAPSPPSPSPSPPPPSGGGAADYKACSRAKRCQSQGFKCFAKNPFYGQCRPSCKRGLHYDEPRKYRTPWSCRVLGGAAPAPATPALAPPPAPMPSPSPTNGYAPQNPVLLNPSSATATSFYVFRVQNDEDYSLTNQNVANLPGAMWYLHHEIVNNRYHRRFGKTRVQRYKLTVKAPQPLIDAGMNFGVRYAFDRGQCTGPYDCQKGFDTFGYFVGCNYIDQFPTKQWAGKSGYADAIWYSLPGKCPSKTFNKHDPKCEASEPGGNCAGPNGKGDCTYSYEFAGEVSIDELEGIKSFKDFAAQGGWEFNNKTDKGVHMTFWNGITDADACRSRVHHAASAFDKKYPQFRSTEALSSPPCDFDYAKFYGIIGSK